MTNILFLLIIFTFIYSSALSRGIVYDSADGEDYNDPEFLLLEVISMGQRLSQGISAYEFEEEIYISLVELANSLSFPIEFDEDLSSFSGWYFKPNYNIKIDIKNKNISLKGDKKPLDKKDFLEYEEEFYINRKSLEKWLEIKLKFDYSQLTIDVESPNKFAFVANLERKRRWKSINTDSDKIESKYPFHKIDYSDLNFPNSTVTLGSSYLSSNDEIDSNYSVQGNGEMAGMSSNYFISGVDSQVFDEMKIRLHRNYNDLEFLGVKIRNIELGDITPVNNSLIGGGSLERGIRISNSNINYSGLDYVVDIEGEITSGWDIEIYRNDQFITYQENILDGRYVFEDIPLIGGVNIFHILQYGPSGEVKEEFKRYFIGSNMIATGNFIYNASLTQQGLLIPNKNEDYDLLDNINFTLNTDYGISNRLSLGSTIYLINIPDRNEAGLSFRIAGDLYGSYNRFEQLFSTNSYLTSYTNLINIKNYSLSTNINFVQELEKGEETLNFDTNFYYNFKFFKIIDLNTRLSFFFEKVFDDKIEKKYEAQLSSNLKWFSLSNEMYMFNDLDSSGKLFINRKFNNRLFGNRNASIRTILQYDISPKLSAGSFSLNFNQNLAYKSNLNFNVSKSLNSNSSPTRYNLELSKTNNMFSMFLNLGIDGIGYSIGTGLRFGFGMNQSGNIAFLNEQEINMGHVDIDVYLDKNENNIMDANDEKLSDVLVTGPRVETTTNTLGVARLGNLKNNELSEVKIEAKSLPDISLFPTQEGYGVIPRLGSNTILKFPVVVRGEIDGMITLQNQGFYNDHFIEGVEIQLYDLKGSLIQTTLTDSSGYYLFSRLKLGRYIVNISSESIEKINYIGQTAYIIELNNDNTAAIDIDFKGKQIIKGEFEFLFNEDNYIVNKFANSSFELPNIFTLNKVDNKINFNSSVTNLELDYNYQTKFKIKGDISGYLSKNNPVSYNKNYNLSKKVHLLDEVKSVIQTTLTDNNGYFYFPDVETGVYFISVSDNFIDNKNYNGIIGLKLHINYNDTQFFTSVGDQVKD